MVSNKPTHPAQPEPQTKHAMQQSLVIGYEPGIDSSLGELLHVTSKIDLKV